MKIHFDLVRNKPLVQPFGSFLYAAYKDARYMGKTTERAYNALTALSSMINSDRFKPLYKESVINRLFEDKVLKIYAAGRYFHDEKLETLGQWNDLLNNTFTVVNSGESYLQSESGLSEEVKCEVIVGLNSRLKMLQIIENWFFYHPDVLKDIIETKGA